jgi:hypothetical protein
MAYRVNGPYGPVVYEEHRGSPEEAYTNQEGKVTRTFDVYWFDRWTFCLAMLGTSVLGFRNSHRYVQRVAPFAYPGVFDVENTGDTETHWLYATSIERIEGLGQPRANPPASSQLYGPDMAVPFGVNPIDFRGVYAYNVARITVGFQPLPYRVYDDDNLLTGVSVNDSTTEITAVDAFGNPDESKLLRYVSRHIQPNAEYLTLPGGQLYWPDGTPSGSLGVGKVIATSEVQFTWHQVPVIPDGIFAQVGTVNHADFVDYAPGLYQSRTYAQGTLLLTGVELKPFRQVNGDYAYDITYRMKHFSAVNPATGALYSPEQGHNYFLRWKNGSDYSYEKLTTRTGGLGVGVYLESDFTKLFKVDPAA